MYDSSLHSNRMQIALSLKKISGHRPFQHLVIFHNTPFLVMLEIFDVSSGAVNVGAHSQPGHHDVTSFLASNLIGKISIDPTKTSTSTSDANYVTSSDIYDDRYLCDTPLTSAANTCGGAVASKGLVGSAGRNFPGSAMGPNASSPSPLGVAGPVNGVPHPSFRFAQKVTDVAFNMQDITNPGQPKLMWNARFRLTGPDGSLGSDYLPSSLPPMPAQDNFAFHKLCSAVNSGHKYQLKIEAGGNAPVNQTIVMDARIVKPSSEIDPSVAASGGGAVAPSGAPKDGSRIQETGPRLYSASGGPRSDTSPALAASFASRHVLTTLNKDDGTMLITAEPKRFASITATSFSDRVPAGCHEAPRVTFHTPKSLQIQQDYQRIMSGGQPTMMGQPSMMRPPMMGQPMMGQPMMGQPMISGGAPQMVASRGFF